ncbi:MAG: hypothetical protein U0935_00120 [Pirellulales bacterium]
MTSGPVTSGLLALALLASGWLPQPLNASEPRVQFDVAALVAARECQVNSLTDGASPDRLPGGRLVEVQLHVSVLVPPDSSRELSELLVRVEPLERRAQVYDFAPRTTLSSDVQGTVQLQRREESRRTLDFQARGQYFGFADGHIEGSSFDQSTTDSHWQQLPALSLCVASGTVNRGSGVYFKFKPTTRSTLEGDHEVGLVLRVPESWRGGCFSLSCESYSRSPTLLSADAAAQLWTSRRFLVAVYSVDDENARQAALDVLHAEAQLRQAVLAERVRRPVRLSSSTWKDWREFWGGTDGRGKDDWWERLIYGPADTASQIAGGASAVPPPLRSAAQRLREARTRLERSPPSRSLASERRGESAVPAVAAGWERLPRVTD